MGVPKNNNDAHINSKIMYGHTQLSTLPEELLLRILKVLPHSDLSSLILVNKKFSSLASDPVLWRHYHVPAKDIARFSGLDVLAKVLQLPRFSKLQVLDLSCTYTFHQISQDSASAQQFQEILITASTLPLKKLDLSDNSLADHPTPDLVSKLVLGIEHVVLAHSFRFSSDDRIRQQILSDILEGISDTSVLRTVNLRGCRLESVPVSLIAKLNCLSSVNLGGSLMTAEQVKVLLTEMGKGSKIVKLGVCFRIIDVKTRSDLLKSVEPGLLARAVMQVEQVDMSCTLSRAHIMAILGQIDTNSKIKRLDLGSNDVSWVPESVLTKAVGVMRTVFVKKWQRKTLISYIN